MRMRVAIVQAEVATDLRAALARTADLAREAAGTGAELIAFPETWIPGYPAWLDVCRDAALWNHQPVKDVFARLAEHSVAVDGPAGLALAEIARHVGVTLVVGVSERVDHHRKLVPTYTERMVWGTGDAAGLLAVDTPVGRVGGLVCWEHWMPLARQALHESGEDVHVAVWPTVHEMHQVASRHYAFEGRCFVLAVGALMRASALPPELEPHPDRVQSPDQWVLRGGSAIIAPDGSYVAGPISDAPCVLSAELDLERIRQESMTLDVGGHLLPARLLRVQPAARAPWRVRTGRTRTANAGRAWTSLDGVDGGMG